MDRVIICCGAGRRIVCYPQGGYHLESYINGPGWCLDDDAPVTDEVIRCHIADAMACLDKVGAPMGV